MKIKEGEPIERKNELYSILVNHLNRYPSTKVYAISKAILANATANNEFVMQKVLDISNCGLSQGLTV